MNSLLDPHNPLAWLLGSLVLAILATNLAGLVFSRGLRGRAAAGAPGGSWLAPIGWLLVSLFFLLPPLGAWRFGALSPYLIGLTEIDWIASLSAGGILVALITGGLLSGWLVYRHSLPVGNAPGRGSGSDGCCVRRWMLRCNRGTGPSTAPSPSASCRQPWEPWLPRPSFPGWPGPRPLRRSTGDVGWAWV